MGLEGMLAAQMVSVHKVAMRLLAMGDARRVEQSEGRIHANVTVASETSDDERTAIAEQLSRVLGKQAMLHVNVNPALLGGVIVKVGDTVMDGSMRKRLATLKSRILAGAA